MAIVRTNRVPDSMSIEVPGFSERQAAWNEEWRRRDARNRAIASERAAWMRSRLNDQSAQARLMADLNPLKVAGEVYAGEMLAAGLGTVGRAATSTHMRPGVVRVPRGMRRVTPAELATADKAVMSPVSARDIEVAEATARTIWNRGTGHSIYEFVDKNLSRIAGAGEKAWDYTVGGAYEKGVERSVKFLAKKLWPGGVTDSALAGRPFGYATAVATGAGAVTGLKLGTDLIYDKWLEDGKKTGAGVKPGDGQAFVEQQETSRTPPSVQMDRRIARRVAEQAYSDYAMHGIDSAEFDYRLAGVKANPELWSEFREREMGRRLSESGSALTMRDLRRMAELGNDKAKAALAGLEKWFDDTPTADLRKKGR